MEDLYYYSVFFIDKLNKRMNAKSAALVTVKVCQCDKVRLHACKNAKIDRNNISVIGP